MPFVGIAAGTVAGLGLGRVCWLVRDLDGGVLVHLAHWGQFDAGVLHDVVRGSVPNVVVVVQIFLLVRLAHGAQCADIDSVLRVRRDRRQMVRLAVLAAHEAVVAAVVTRLGFQDEVLAGEGVKKDVDQAGTGNQGTRNAKEGHVGGFALGCRHSSGGQGKRENNVGNGVDNHVSDDATKTLQTLRVAASQDGGLLDLATQLEPHDSVQGNGAELGQENPDIVSP